MILPYDPAKISALYELYRSFDLVIDSRRVTRPGQTLFFALPGRKRHGNEFIEALRNTGVRHFVVAAPPQVPGTEEEQGTVTWVIAQDPVQLLQDLAAHHRGHFDLPVVGITGSNGKTIVKDWLTQALATTYKVCSSPRSYNSQIGVPLSVWQLDGSHEVAVFEAGISRVGEMERLARIIRPTDGIFTMLGAAHADGFPDEATKLREKLLLFRDCTVVVLPDSLDVDVDDLLHDLDVTMVEYAPPYTRRADLPLSYQRNAGLVVDMAGWMKVDSEHTRRIARTWQPLRNRLEQTEGLHGAPVINDSYSNDPDALAAAIDFAAAQSPTGKICLILGTVQGDGDTILTGDERLASVIRVGGQSAGSTEGPSISTPEVLLASLSARTFPPLPILVKGASYERLDRVAAALSRRRHRTVLRIDLGALQHNFAVYRERTSAEMIAMVKASAYGGGSLPVARAVAEAGADRLAVAYADEGVELRQGGVELPVLVLNPELREFDLLAEYGLEPAVGNPAGLRAARELDLPVHLEVDTGMSRLGFAPEDVLRWSEGAGLPEIRSVFSHLVGSEEERHDSFTRRQAATFDRVVGHLSGVLGYRPLRHLLNSNGISRWPDFAYDAVRLGIGLYGIGDATLASRLRPALQMTCLVSAVHERPAGATIGYNRRGVLSRDSRIATLSIGYADGLPRLAGEGRFSVRIRGRWAPTVGAVCMDMTMVDVTTIPEVRVGEEATIFGPDRPVEDLAYAARTIPYEILTGIGPRVHRIYVRE